MKWLTTYRVLSEMTEHLRWSTEELRRYRLWKLREVVRHAFFNSPFYRQFYGRQGIHPDDIRSLDDLKKLPILEKAMLQQVGPDQVCTLKSEAGVMIEVTSGSMGMPLRILRTWRDLYYIKAKIIRSFRQTGLRFYHRQAVLKSSAESLTGRHWFENFGILRKYWLSVVDPPEVNLRKLRRIRPHHVHGYPSGLLAIAELLQSRGQTFRIPNICCGAEVLDEPMRQAIENAFQAEVFDLYGTREVGNVAWECRAHQGLHINDDALIVELLDELDNEVPEGREGEIVVTYLDAYDFPFIRYRLGDRALRMPGNCPCGVNFGRLQQITGRSDSRIRLPSGEWVSGLVFQELRMLTCLAAFRILQDDPACVRLQLVFRDEAGKSEVDAIVKRTAGLLRNELQVIPEILPELEREAGGKIRAVICRLPQESTARS